jgi:predicted P-loop ATPase
MRVKGRLLVEIPEMKGMQGKEVQHIRDWITRRYEQWRAMRENDITEYRRRFVIVGTANGRELLTDPEGNRRWLPIDAGVCDPDALARDRDQLWAEGVARWTQHGVLWRDAERLAKDVHEDFRVEDSWEVLVGRWLDEQHYDLAKRAFTPSLKNSDLPISTADVLQLAIKMTPDKIKRADETRIGIIMKQFGYRKRRPTINGERGWRYVK